MNVFPTDNATKQGKKSKGEPGRPLNAFLVFRVAKCKELGKPGENQKFISKDIGALWRGMSDEEKKPYYEKAEKIKEEHSLQYPDYKYQPRRRSTTSKGKPKQEDLPDYTMPALAMREHFVDMASHPFQYNDFGYQANYPPNIQLVPSLSSSSSISNISTDNYISDPFLPSQILSPDMQSNDPYTLYGYSQPYDAWSHEYNNHAMQ